MSVYDFPACRRSLPRARGVAATALVLFTLLGCGKPEPTRTDDPTPPVDGFLVTGTVSGLEGSALGLTLNGVTRTLGSSDKQFIFNGVPPKSNYTVTITAQPIFPWQTCTIANASGQATTDVNNVVVTCTTNRYNVRGTVTGLTGAGLVLQLNGANPQAIPIGATSFSFPNILSLTDVAVTVATQPAGQTCVVINGTGLMRDADLAAITIACGAPGFSLGGDFVGGISGSPPTLRFNGGAVYPLPQGVESPPFPTFAFPFALATGTSWNVVIVDHARSPLFTCTLVGGKGRMATSNVTSMQVQCFANSGLDSYEGTYSVLLDGKPQFLTVWFDGTYSLATRLDAPSCANSGNGIEYGVYRRATDGTLRIRIGKQDTNGDCGLNDPNIPFASAPSGQLIRNGNTLTLRPPGDTSTIVLTAVESNPASLVGGWVRADGNDGTFLVFGSDGSYLAFESQTGVNINVRPGYERGCYTVSGTMFEATVATSCRPNNAAAIDANGTDGGFAGRGAIPFTLTSPTTATIGGLLYKRSTPGG